jgi:hypothetical protein
MASRTVPTSVRVFGIVNTAFGTLGLLSALNNVVNMGKAQEAYKVLKVPAGLMQLAQVQMVIAPIMSLVLLALGIGLLMKQPWSRSASVYYAMFVIGFGVLSLVATIAVVGGSMSNPIAIATIVASFVGLLFGAVYYGLMIYFLNKPEVRESIG